MVTLVYSKRVSVHNNLLHSVHTNPKNLIAMLQLLTFISSFGSVTAVNLLELSKDVASENI